MKYRSPEAFKQALSERLKELAQIRKVPLLRLQTRFLFERLLLRVQAAFPDVTVKGGAALEFRLAVARVTKDLDLGLHGVPPETVLPRLQRVAQSDFGDWINFLIEEHPDYPELQIDGLIYTGRRLRVRAHLVGRPLFGGFGLDVVVGEIISDPPEQFLLPSCLADAGLEPLELRLISLEQHIAEKLHAYTQPRSRPNSRVKDLPDLALLASHRTLDRVHLFRTIQATYANRGTHTMPTRIDSAPAAWEIPYSAMAAANALLWPTLESVTRAVRLFLDPVLTGPASASCTWDPTRWFWNHHSAD